MFVPTSKEWRHLFHQAREIATQLEQDLTSAHLLLSLFLMPTKAESLLLDRGITEDVILTSINSIADEPPNTLAMITQRSQQIAFRTYSEQIDSLHLLIAMSRVTCSMAYQLLERCQVSLPMLRNQAMSYLSGRVRRRFESMIETPSREQSAHPDFDPGESYIREMSHSADDTVQRELPSSFPGRPSPDTHPDSDSGESYILEMWDSVNAIGQRSRRTDEIQDVATLWGVALRPTKDQTISPTPNPPQEFSSSSRAYLKIQIDTNIEDLNWLQLHQILQELRGFSNDVTLDIRCVYKGSVVLWLELNESSAEKVLSSWSSGTLKSLDGWPILHIQRSETLPEECGSVNAFHLSYPTKFDTDAIEAVWGTLTPIELTENHNLASRYQQILSQRASSFAMSEGERSALSQEESLHTAHTGLLMVLLELLEIYPALPLTVASSIFPQLLCLETFSFQREGQELWATISAKPESPRSYEDEQSLYHSLPKEVQDSLSLRGFSLLVSKLVPNTTYKLELPSSHNREAQFIGLRLLATPAKTPAYSSEQIYKEAEDLWENGGGGPLSQELFKDFATLGGFPQFTSSSPETRFPAEENQAFLELLQEWLRSAPTGLLSDDIEELLTQLKQAPSWLMQRSLLQELGTQGIDHCKIGANLMHLLLRGSDPVLLVATKASAQIRTSFVPVILALIELCLQRNHHVGEHASNALAAISEPALPYLIKALDREPGSINSVTSIFRNIGPASIPFLIDAFDPKQSQRSSTIVYILSEIRPPSAESITKLTELLTDSDEFRSNAARSLRSLGTAAIPTLCPLLRHENAIVRHTSIETLKEIVQEQKENAKEALFPLVDALFSNDGKVVSESAYALSYLGREVLPALAQIEQAFHHPTPGTFPYSYLIGALKNIGEEASPVVARLLAHTDTRVRGGIASVVPSTPSEAWQQEVLPILIELLKREQNEDTLRSVIGAIQKFGEKARDAIDGLIAHLAVSNQLSRTAAITLGVVAKGSTQAASAICEIYWTYPGEKDVYIRVLEGIGVVGPLIRLFREEMEQGSYIPRELWYSLAEFGEQAVAVLPVLLELMQKANQESIIYSQSMMAMLLGAIGIKAKEAIPFLIQCYKTPQLAGMSNGDSRDDILAALLLVSADEPFKAILQLIQSLLPEIPEIKQQVIKQLGRQRDRRLTIEVGRNSKEIEWIRDQAAKIANYLESNTEDAILSNPPKFDSPTQDSSEEHHQEQGTIDEVLKYPEIQEKLIKFDVDPIYITCELLESIATREAHPGKFLEVWSPRKLAQRSGGHIVFGEEGGQYLVTDYLAQGQFGQTFRAVALQEPNRWVCVKIPFVDSKNRETTLKAFFEEARSMKGLHHPTLVKCETFGQIDEESYFLVMEYIKGRPLYDVSLVPWDIEKRFRCFQQLVGGIAYLHNLKRIHGDLSPRNVLIESNTNHAKLIDFGMMRTSESIRHSSMHTAVVGSSIHLKTEETCIIGLGTKGYIAPEARLGAITSRKCDVFSLGCILFYLLAMKTPPWNGAIVLGDRTEPGATRAENDPDPDLPQGHTPFHQALRTIFPKVVAYNPDERWSIQDVQEYLEAFDREAETQ